MPPVLRGSGDGDLLARLDVALGELPRFIVVVNQSEDGWRPGLNPPTTMACFSVDDVREMLATERNRTPTSGEGSV